MARQPRFHFPGALFHVMARGNGGQKLFLDDSHYEEFIKIVGLVKKDLPFDLFAFCLMPNHIHLLIRVEQVPISIIMQRILLRYAKYFNYRHRRWGHVFQRRFKAILCEQERYLLTLLQYIHLNPVRAKLVKDPAQWPWSGHRQYLGRPDGGSLCDIRIPLSTLAGDDIIRAQRRYARLIRAGIKDGHRDDLYPLKEFPCLGSDAFKAVFENRRLLGRIAPGQVSLGELASQLGTTLASDHPELLFTRRHAASPIKREFVLRARQAGHRSVRIAEFLSCTPSAVTRIAEHRP